jgi:glycolate oxidase iron-sulfur subunit
MPWVTEDAPTTAELDSCVSCGLCLPHCPTFRITGDETASPRGRLAAMSAVADGLADVDEVFAGIMNFCLQCRACEVVCPSLVPFGRAMEGARAEITEQLPSKRRLVRHFFLGRVLGMRRLLRIASTVIAISQRLGLHKLPVAPAARLRGLRRLPLRGRMYSGSEWSGRDMSKGTAALLTGCVMEPWFDPVHQATVGLLQRAGYSVKAPSGQTCCGALAAHDGAAREARSLASKNIASLAGFDLIVVNSAGCGAHLKDYGNWGGREIAAATRDITEVVADLIASGGLPELPANGRRIAVQDPCHLRHAQRITQEPHRILEAAGYETVEVDPAGWCCGAAGAYTLVHPQTSAELGAIKAEQVIATNARVVASANPGCEMQLRSHLGSDFRVAHPVELYWEALRASTYNEIS